VAEGGGGGGGVPINWDIVDPEFWSDWHFPPGSGQHEQPDYLDKAWVRRYVPGFTEEGWRNPLERVRIIDVAWRIWQAAKQADPKSEFAKRVRRLERRGKLEQKFGAERAAALRAAQRPQTPPPTGPQQPPGPPVPTTATQQPAWLRLLELASEQWQLYRQQQAERAQQRAQRRALRMSLSDTLGDVLGSAIPAITTAVPAILQQRAEERALRRALKTQQFSASGIPLPLNLFEQGSLEEPDLLERIGIATGLEGAVEREATFFTPTPTGVRAVSELQARNPLTGRLHVWRNMGRPVLYSGDMATCKRVNKIAGRVARVARRRGQTRKRR
jgi:hypothetical protein